MLYIYTVYIYKKKKNMYKFDTDCQCVDGVTRELHSWISNITDKM